MPWCFRKKNLKINWVNRERMEAFEILQRKAAAWSRVAAVTLKDKR